MKKYTLTIVAALLFSNLSFAHNGDPKPSTATSTVATDMPLEAGVSLKDIFLADYEGVVLFIDFLAVKDNVTSLNVIMNNKVVLTDDVHNLPANTMYELALEKLTAGKYLVELKTEQGISIQKELIIE